jgi:L-asparaginase
VTAGDLTAAVSNSPDGLVLECYGSGTAPMARTGMAQVLRDICSTIPVVAITQCATGGIDASRYAVGGELADTGVMNGADMTVEAALAKLSFGLDAGLDIASLRPFMQLNLVGERS